MTREEAIKEFESELKWAELNIYPYVSKQKIEADNMAIKALGQESCEDCVSRIEALNSLDKVENKDSWYRLTDVMKMIRNLPPVTPQPNIGYCKNCKWWKDSDGAYRRGIGAESLCPMNRLEVLEGNGYCYMFKPQESEDKE